MSFAVGIDLSLTSTGIAALSLDSGEMFTHVIRSTGTKKDRLPEHLTRLDDLVSQIVESVRQVDPAAVAIESATFVTAQDSSSHRRAGLWWSVSAALAADYPLVEMAPTSVKKFATGNGRSDKLAVALAVAKQWGDDVLPDARADRADAAALAAAVSYRLGTPSMPQTAYRDQVIARVNWNTTRGEITPLEETVERTA